MFNLSINLPLKRGGIYGEENGKFYVL